MDPLSVTASVVGILETVSKLSSAVYRFTQDYKLADEELNAARSHALLLKDEIMGLESRKASSYLPPRKTVKSRDGFDRPAVAECLAMGESSFEKAMSTAHGLLSDIEAAFPLRLGPHTWRSKVRWAMKDKRVLVDLRKRLQSAESTLQGIVSTEQLRLSRMIYGVLLQQQDTLDKMLRGEATTKSVINMAVISQASPQSAAAVLQAQLSEIKPSPKRPTQLITKPSKLLPRTVRFERWGSSAQIITLPKDKGTSYRAAVHISLFGKMYSVTLQLSYPGFSFDRMLHIRNIVPTDSEIAMACKTGNFDLARKLLTNGEAHGSDITQEGWPMLDYAIESGSARLVRLLLEHGADPDMAYGEYNMTALQSSFLRGNLDIARMLLGRGADIEHVDNDGYSVLSYLWVVDGQLEKSVDFMRLCQMNDFGEVNACDSRGWTALHRAAAIGTPEDVEVFLRLGASLDLRAEWYGWTALFFAASHDNIATFETIVSHSGDNVYESLDGDGWNLLHCCVYFGAPRVMRLVLQNGVDVNQKTHPAPLPEDPELSYKELTASDIALYIGPNRYKLFLDALVQTGRDADLDCDEMFWDAHDSKVGDGDAYKDGGESRTSRPIYGAEDIDDRWTLLHWASYNGSPKVKRLLLLKGADPEHLNAIMLEDNPTLLPTSPFKGG